MYLIHNCISCFEMMTKISICLIILVQATKTDINNKPESMFNRWLKNLNQRCRMEWLTIANIKPLVKQFNQWVTFEKHSLTTGKHLTTG